MNVKLQVTLDTLTTSECFNILGGHGTYDEAPRPNVLSQEDQMWQHLQQEVEQEIRRFTYFYHVSSSHENIYRNVIDDLTRNPQQLLVNFMLMGVQFLENFERYILMTSDLENASIVHKASSSEC